MASKARAQVARPATIRHVCGCCGVTSTMKVPPKDGAYWRECGGCGYELPFYVKNGIFHEGEDPEEQARLSKMTLEELREEIRRGN